MSRAGESVFIFAIVSDHFPRLDAQLGDIEGSRSCRSEESGSIGLPLVHDWLVRDFRVAIKRFARLTVFRVLGQVTTPFGNGGVAAAAE